MSGSICCRIYIWVFWYSVVSHLLIFQRYLTCLIPYWLLCILVWFCFYISWVSILTFIAFILHSKSYSNSKQNLAYWEECTNKDNTALFIVFTQGLAWWWPMHMYKGAKGRGRKQVGSVWMCCLVGSLAA